MVKTRVLGPTTSHHVLSLFFRKGCTSGAAGMDELSLRRLLNMGGKPGDGWQQACYENLRGRGQCPPVSSPVK
jgi:hypothetical protein